MGSFQNVLAVFSGQFDFMINILLLIFQKEINGHG